jgi:3-phosphoshikimate 1-carboxyvinyltransferase
MTERHYPDRLEIVPLTKPPHATIRVPGSKSITNRALVLAALSGHECTLTGAGLSEDSALLITALRTLGVLVSIDSDDATMMTVRGAAEKPHFPIRSADLFLGNSGTSVRFLTAALATGPGRYRIDGLPRMRERPIEDLLVALRQLGAGAYSEGRNGCPPVLVDSPGLHGGSVRIKGDVSSQFLSALLMAAPLADGDVHVAVDGPLVSAPYVRMTIEIMRQFGAHVNMVDRTKIVVRKNARPYGAILRYDIESDASAASYFFGAASITNGKVGIVTSENLVARVLQGDFRFVDLLEKMGSSVRRDEQVPWRVQGRALHGIDADMNDISDCVPTLAAVACFAEGPTTIRNVAHIRHKESDRITAMATELRKVGADVDESPDGLRITPQPLHGAEIETYDDHRIAMSMALIGLKVPGIVIKNPGCVAKTYPGFWNDLEKLRQ